MDAYCPHLGANLGVGGLVRGDCIECPFHLWKFRGIDGECVNIPYSKNGTGNIISLIYIFLIFRNFVLLYI